MVPLISGRGFARMRQVSGCEVDGWDQVSGCYAVRVLQVERSCLFYLKRQRRCPAAWLSSLRTRYARVAAGGLSALRACGPSSANKFAIWLQDPWSQSRKSWNGPVTD